MGLNLGDESVGTYGNGTYGDNSSAHMDELISGKKRKMISISSFTSRLCCILLHLITMCITFPCFKGVDEVVDAERAEALLYLAGYYKEQGRLPQAELLCSRYSTYNAVVTQPFSHMFVYFIYLFIFYSPILFLSYFDSILYFMLTDLWIKLDQKEMKLEQ